MISVNSLLNRQSGFRANDWILDSGAFSQINKHGKFVLSADDYLEMIYKFASCGNLKAAICQDYMCEPFILERTGLTVAEHQRRTLASYFYLNDFSDIPVMPVLQGYFPQDYVNHLREYNSGPGRGIEEGAWVGVGSVCKRNGNPDAIEDILLAIKRERPDLRLHGFGLKITALKRATIRSLLYSSDSMAWSVAERHDGSGSNNDPRKALKYCAQVQGIIDTPTFVQNQLFDWWK
jgi:hypothetical protein